MVKKVDWPNILDENEHNAGSEKLMEVLDHLNAKDSMGMLYFAAQDIH